MENKIKTFAGLEEDEKSYPSSEIVLLPVPYEKTTTYIKGTEHGPFAILNASPNLEFYDCDLDFVALNHAKIATLPPLLLKNDPEDMVKNVAEAVENIVKDNKLPIVLGGEHSITIGSFRGVNNHYKDISVVQLDAHADLRDAYEGSNYNHACVMRRIAEDAHICQIGIRAIDVAEAEIIKENHYDVFFAKDIVNNNSWHERALSGLKDNVYLTFDIDVFDPSFMPSTGTPEPGGLGWYEVLSFLKKLVMKKNIVGMDIMELCPMNNNKGPDFIAAKLLYQLITYVTYKKTLHNNDI